MTKTAITRLALSKYIKDLPTKCHLVVIPTPARHQTIIIKRAQLFEDKAAAKKTIESMPSSLSAQLQQDLQNVTKFRYRPHLVLSSRYQDIIERAVKDIEKGHLPVVLINEDGVEIWKRLPGEKVALNRATSTFHIQKPIKIASAQGFEITDTKEYTREVIVADPPVPGMVDVLPGVETE